MLTEPILVTLKVSEALTNLEIPYFIGGSLAMAIHGVPRTILNVDLVADFQTAQIQPFWQDLKAFYFSDEQFSQHAIQQGKSCSLIHKEIIFKVNIFPTQNRPFDCSQFERRTPYTLARETDQVIYIASPEDSILAQLAWHRRGNEISDRYWRDVLGVFKIQGKHIDQSYLEHWATELMVSILLARACEQVSARNGGLKQ